MGRLLIVTLLSLVSASAFAGAGITYAGRLIRSDGTAVENNLVQFKMQIRTPGNENCLLYEETYSLDMTNSSGMFAITINDGTATSVNTEPFTIDRAFQNRGTFTFGGGKCGIGTTFTPNPADGRKLVVQFNDGSFAGWESLPAQQVNYVPMAMESMTVGGFSATNFLRVLDGSGNPVSLSPWTQANYTALTDLVGGTSTMYRSSVASIPAADISGNIAGNAAGFTGALAGDVTGTQSATVVAKIQGRAVDTASPTNGQVLKWNSGNNRWEPSTDNAGNSGTVTSVTGTGAVVMTGTATDPIVGVQDASTSVKGVVQLSASGGTTAGQVVQANDSRLSDARAPTAHHHGYDEIDSAVGKYLTYKPNNAACADGQVIKWIAANSRWECANDAGAAGTVASLTVNSPLVKTGTAADPIVSIQDASTSQKGAVQLAASGDTTAGLVVQANDTRLTDARTPTAHTHVVDQITSAVGKYFSYLPNNAACADGELLKWNLAQTRWECGTAASSESTSVSNAGSGGVGVFSAMSGTQIQLKNINAASGGAITVTNDAANKEVDIGVNAELAALANLNAAGFVKRGAGSTYSSVSSIGLAEMNMNTLMGNNTGVLVTDGTQMQNKACSVNEVLKWLSPSGWTCAADAGLTVESDPKVGSNTLNYLSKWNNTALVTSSVFDNGTLVGIGTTSGAGKLNLAQTTASGSGNDEGLWVTMNPTSDGESHVGMAATDGTKLFMATKRAAGSFNPLTLANDSTINFQGSGGADTGGLVIAPWSASAKGLRIDAATGSVGIGTTATSSKLVVDGAIESKSGGVKFPDGSTQTTAVTLANNLCSSGQVLQGFDASGAKVCVAAGGGSGNVTYTQLTTSYIESCALRSDNYVQCWGYNYYGGLGNGSATQSNVPVMVRKVDGSFLKATKVVASNHYSKCAIQQSDSTVWCWGYNDYGQLGNGGYSHAYVATKVSTLGAVIDLAGGQHSFCALDSSGNAWCWGYNSGYQLGDGTTTTRPTPTAVLNGAAQLTGMNHITMSASNVSCAYNDSSGTNIYCWGYNGYGQIGNNVGSGYATTATLVTNTAFTTDGITKIVSVVAGGESYNWYGSTCAIGKTGSNTYKTYCWGWNGYGQIMDGTTTNRPAPVVASMIGTQSAIPEISIQGYNACHLIGTTIRCIGYNGYGELGDGTATSNTAAFITVKDFGGSGTFSAAHLQIAGGMHQSYEHMCAISTTGLVGCWGYGAYGALGDNRATTTYYPVGIFQ